MKEYDQIFKGDQNSEHEALSEDPVKCASCESTNVEIYSKNDHRFIMCLDCGRIELFD
jgi:hypothetical protein